MAGAASCITTAWLKGVDFCFKQHKRMLEIETNGVF
jgi:hypothetical protein